MSFFFFFFLVITFDFNIFYPHFSNLYHFSPKMSDFLQKTTKLNVFSAKFSKNPRKTQGLFENPRKNPRPSEKNPRTQDCFRKPKILGENPSSGNADGNNNSKRQDDVFIKRHRSTHRPGSS